MEVVHDYIENQMEVCYKKLEDLLNKRFKRKMLNEFCINTIKRVSL